MTYGAHRDFERHRQGPALAAGNAVAALIPSPRLTTEFLALRADFRRRGFFEPRTRRVIGEFVSHLVICLGGLAVVVSSESWAVKIIALLVSTAGHLGIGTNAHTASHQAATRSRRLNKVMGWIGHPLFSQISSSYWHEKHVVRHHPAPNVVGVDDDIDLAPWFAITEDHYQAASSRLRTWYDVQWVLFPVAVLINGFQFQFTSWAFVLRKLRSPSERRPEHWYDLGAMVVHVLVWIALPLCIWDPFDVLLLYTVRNVLMGVTMFAVFAPAHFPHEAAAVAQKDHRADFALLQCGSTIDFRAGPIASFFCSGLDYQIEHHLFPTISHVHFRRMRPLLRDFCARNGYPYRVLPWWLATWKSLAILRRRKPVLPDLTGLRSGAGVKTRRRLADVGQPDDHEAPDPDQRVRQADADQALVSVVEPAPAQPADA